MINDMCPTKLYRFKNSKKGYNIIFVEDELGDITPLVFHDSNIVNAFIRASLNKKHIPKYKTAVDNTKIDVSIAGLLCALGFISGVVSCYFLINIF